MTIHTQQSGMWNFSSIFTATGRANSSHEICMSLCLFQFPILRLPKNLCRLWFHFLKLTKILTDKFLEKHTKGVLLLRDWQEISIHSGEFRISHGVANPQGGAPTYYLAKIFPKTGWKWKKLDPVPPLDPPMIQVIIKKIIKTRTFSCYILSKLKHVTERLDNASCSKKNTIRVNEKEKG